jgi:hypothetical protein
MSLLTDIIFVKALRSNAELIEQLPAGDVYNTAIALPDEEADNAPLPYIIVSFNGLNNQDTTKDDAFESESDSVQIGITICAKEREEVGEISVAVRRTIREYFREHYGDDSDEDYALIPNDTSLSAQGIQYDSMKPCHWIIMNYQCDTDID